MSKDLPFQPKGHCADCKFSAPTSKRTGVGQHYPLLCHRVPPTPATGFSDIWSKEPAVQEDDFCAMFEPAVAEKTTMKIDYKFFETSHWDCEDSPTGHCLYTKEIGFDCCIFCSLPEERK